MLSPSVVFTCMWCFFVEYMFIFMFCMHFKSLWSLSSIWETFVVVIIHLAAAYLSTCLQKPVYLRKLIPCLDQKRIRFVFYLHITRNSYVLTLIKCSRLHWLCAGSHLSCVSQAHACSEAFFTFQVDYFLLFYTRNYSHCVLGSELLMHTVPQHPPL